jgi:hypothetical protein
MAALGVWAAGSSMSRVTDRCFSEDLIFPGKPAPNHWSSHSSTLNPRPRAKSKSTSLLPSTILRSARSKSSPNRKVDDFCSIWPAPIRGALTLEIGEIDQTKLLAQHAYPQPPLLIASPGEARRDGDRRQISDATPLRNKTDGTRVALSQGVARGLCGPPTSYH